MGILGALGLRRVFHPFPPVLAPVDPESLGILWILHSKRDLVSSTASSFKSRLSRPKGSFRPSRFPTRDPRGKLGTPWELPSLRADIPRNSLFPLWLQGLGGMGSEFPDWSRQSVFSGSFTDRLDLGLLPCVGNCGCWGWIPVCRDIPWDCCFHIRGFGVFAAVFLGLLGSHPCSSGHLKMF